MQVHKEMRSVCTQGWKGLYTETQQITSKNTFL